MENTKTHLYASLLFNIALIAAALQFREFQMAQLGCLLFFPLWVALSKISKNPRVELAFGRWFPVVGAAILAFVVSIPYWNEAEAIRFFRRESLPSFGLLLMMFFAGYVGVYFAFSEKENWWNRWALAISCFILWWWLFQAVPSRYEAASWILAPFVVVPLFWRLAGLFPEKRFEALLNSNETLPESNLLRILYNDDMPRELRRKALDEIRSDEVLYRLYLDENLEDKLARAALEKIGSEAILKQVIEDEEEEEKTRLACLEKISDESVLSEILHKTQSRAIRRAILQRISSQDELIAIFENAKNGDQVRLAALEKIDQPGYLEKILWDEEQKDIFRLPLLGTLTDYSLFKKILPTFKDSGVQEKAVRSVAPAEWFDLIFRDRSFPEEARKTAAEKLFENGTDILSEDFLRFQLEDLLPGFLEKGAVGQVVQVLRNVMAFHGQFQASAFLEKHVPVQKLLDWYSGLIPEKKENLPKRPQPRRQPQEGLLLTPDYSQAGMDEKEPQPRLAAAKEEKISLHWAMGHCLSILPSVKALPTLKALFVDLENEKHKQTDEEAVSSQKNYFPDMAAAALLRAMGFCAARDASYLNFDKDQELLKEVNAIQHSMKSLQNEARELYDARKVIIDRHLAQQLHPNALMYDPEFQNIEQELRAVIGELNTRRAERDQVILQLSAGNFLTRAAYNERDYSAYVRQHAAVGLNQLLNHSDLEEAARKEISEALRALRKTAEESQADEGHGAPETEVPSLEEHAKHRLPDEEGDPRFSTYELRLLPGTKTGELNYLLYDTLLQVSEEEQPLPPMNYLLETVKELCRCLPEAIRFLEKHPLKLMPFALRSRLAYYRETGYGLQLWTRYIPPRDVPGNVQFRYLEVLDYSQPNSMGMVYRLLFHPLLSVPVLYHEYQHYLGRKNEAEVWLREHYFLRRRIIERAPGHEQELAAYFNFVTGLFLSNRDFLTLSMLKTNFRAPESLDCLNQVITLHYGPQMEQTAARQYAGKVIDRENFMLNLTNFTLNWDPQKRFPLLGQTGAEEEGKLVRKIIAERRMQKNTLTEGELANLLEEPEMQETEEAWQALLNRMAEAQSIFGAFPGLCQLLDKEKPEEDLLVYKS